VTLGLITLVLSVAIVVGSLFAGWRHRQRAPVHEPPGGPHVPDRTARALGGSMVAFGVLVGAFLVTMLVLVVMRGTGG
jgi:hypothetical protein